MSEYYNPIRSRNLYESHADEPYRLSRSKIELYVDCKRCFYIDRKLGVGRPPGFPFNLNSAVDTLLKKEFDFHRKEKTQHPLMKHYGIDAVPFAHESMDDWRDSLRRGVVYHHGPTNLIITGGVDDVWATPAGELIVVDYKATSKEGEVNIDAPWQMSYKRQMEIYQWLFRKNGYTVSPTGYFVYCNGQTDREAFDAKLEFDVTLLPYTGNDAWIEPVLFEIKKCLDGDLPLGSDVCDYCRYRMAVRGLGVENELT